MKLHFVVMAVLLVIILGLVLFLKNQVPMAADWDEADYQAYILEKIGGEAEYVLKDGSRVDILTPEYAIEIDYAHKWAEAIGQSLYYAEASRRNPGIVLILAKRDNYNQYVKRVLLMANKYAIAVWTVDISGNLKKVK